MTLKLKINPYDTLFIAKFQIFSYQRQDSSCPIRASISASRHKWKQIGSNHWNELQSKIRTLRRNPVIRWPMTLLSSIKVNALRKIKTSISLKNAIFFIFYNRRSIFFFFTKNNYCGDKPLGTYFTESCIVLQTYSKEFTTTGSFVGSSWYLSRWP